MNVLGFLARRDVITEGFQSANTQGASAAPSNSAKELAASPKPEPIIILASGRRETDPEYLASMTP